MKVLYSCLSQSWGGMEMFTIQTAQKLREHEINVVLLCYPNSKIHVRAVELNIETMPVKAAGYFHPFELMKVFRFILKENFDIVHTHASKDLWILTPALKFARSSIPLFLTKHVGSFIVKKDFLHKYIYSRVTTAFAISNVIKKNLLNTVPLSENKIVLLHDAVDTKIFDPAKHNRNIVRKEFNIGNEKIVIGMLARFSSGKGHEDFLSAAKTLNKKFGNLIFMIVGEPSRGEEDYAAKIKQLCSEYGLADKVIFTGFRSDTPAVLAAMDIFAFPSHSEAFGIALVEAMSMAKPNVAANSDGILDIAVNGVTSYLFKNGNHTDLADKLERFILSNEKRKSFGTAARKRAVEMFDFEILTRRMIDFYNEAIKKTL